MDKQKYFLVKEVRFIVVRAETQEQALEEYGCHKHTQFSHGQAYIYDEKPVEATHAWEAKNIFDERIRKQ